MSEIVNRVSKSSLIQIDMADFFPKEEIVGYDSVIKSGGNVVTIGFLKGFSTTKIVEKARK